MLLQQVVHELVVEADIWSPRPSFDVTSAMTDSLTAEEKELVSTLQPLWQIRPEDLVVALRQWMDSPEGIPWE